MVALVNEGLLEVFLKRLDVEVINDLSQDSEGVGFAHLILVLSDVFSELGYHDEYFILICFQFLSFVMDYLLTLIKTYINLRRLIVATVLTWKSLVTLKNTVLFSASGNSSPYNYLACGKDT